ncbi:MAG: signal peptidase I [Deltaproteobacteria bacterium]|nr:signal peptidase I [Deltaproteobacteria bacterium]MBW2529998.1 signal peptidase I [Deltaproteobacteria bacterium]
MTSPRDSKGAAARSDADPHDDEDVGETDPDDATPASADGVSRSQGGAVLRYLFYLLWLLLTPLGLAFAAVWALTPPPSEYDADLFRSFVGEQQVPAMILFFTLFAMVLWRFRYALPLASASGILARSDLPPRLRARFDDAAQLLDEAQRILRTRRREVERALTRSEREELRDALDDLAETMAAKPLDEELFVEDLESADKLVAKRLARWRKGELREYGESIGIAVAVALLLRFFVIEAFKIPSGSMIPTLMIGDHIFVAKYAYGPLLPMSDTRLYDRLPPQHGDVMVFKFPENEEQDFIKRVVALPGDKLEALDGRLVINGWMAPNCHVGPFGAGPGATGQLYVEYLHERAYLTMYADAPGAGPCEVDGDCAAGAACRGGVCGQLQGPYYVADGEVWVMGDNRGNSHDSRSWRNGLGAGVPFENIKGRAMFVWLSWNEDGSLAPDRLFVSVMGQPQLPAGASPSLVQSLARCLAKRPPLDATTPPGPE